jgi:hypothetical protein
MASVVFDIETVGVEWESLDDAQRTYLQKNTRTEELPARRRSDSGTLPEARKNPPARFQRRPALIRACARINPKYPRERTEL